MADISKCSGDGCKDKERCYRYTAPDGFWQSYFKTPPIDHNGECGYFWRDHKADNNGNSK